MGRLRTSRAFAGRRPYRNVRFAAVLVSSLVLSLAAGMPAGATTDSGIGLSPGEEGKLSSGEDIGSPLSQASEERVAPGRVVTPGEGPSSTEDFDSSDDSRAEFESEVPATVELSGEILVLPSEVSTVSAVLGEQSPEPQIAHDGGVFLETDGGAQVRLEGLPSGASGLYEANGVALASGQRIVTQVTVPENVRDAVVAETAHDAASGPDPASLEGSAELAELVAEAAQMLAVPLPAESFSALPEVPPNAAPVQHTAHVVFFNKADSGYASPSAVTVNNAIARLGEYWGRNSGGQITGIIQGAAPIITTTTADVCNYNTAWNEAARLWGHPNDMGYWTNGNSARHLIVFVAASACPGSQVAGIASVGSGIDSGGVVHLTADLRGDSKYWDGTLTHEFGHNLSLGHSNMLDCPAGQSDANSCPEFEYHDLYDVMGGGYTLYSDASYTRVVASNQYPVAELNVTHKAKLESLGVASSGDLLRVTATGGATQTFSVRAAGSGSGLRGLQVVDPSTNTEFYVEYRSGTGNDAGTFYSQSLPPISQWRSCATSKLDTGVRVLKLQPVNGRSQSSAALDRKVTGVCHPYFRAGDVMTSTSGEVKISVGTITSAESQIKVEFPFASIVLPQGERIYGPGRYETAVEVSKRTYPNAKRGTVVVASGEFFPDALGAAPLAAKEQAPLLLTTAQSLPPAVLEEIVRLDPAKVIIIGGEGAISTNVRNTIKSAAKNQTDWVQLSGENRYSTSQAIVSYGWPQGSSEVFIASGDGFADALSAGSAAGAEGFPVLLVPSTQAAVPESVPSRFGRTRIHIAGGPGSVHPSMVQSLRNAGKQVVSYAGVDRFDTSAQIAGAFGEPQSSVYLANGFNFPDALAGAAAAGAQSATLMISEQGCIPSKVFGQLRSLMPIRIYLLGGSASLSDAVRNNSACR